MILLQCYCKRKGEPCKEIKGKVNEPFVGMDFPSSGLITVIIAPGEEAEVFSRAYQALVRISAKDTSTI